MDTLGTSKKFSIDLYDITQIQKQAERNLFPVRCILSYSEDTIPSITINLRNTPTFQSSRMGLMGLRFLLYPLCQLPQQALPLA